MAYSGGTIVNPSIPYNCPIPGGLQNGKMIIVQGTCHRHQNTFSVNLSCTPQMNPLGDMALHFNPRFNDHCIVRNHQQYNAWGQEERDGGMPMHKGTPFELIILCNPHQFKISINGRHFTNFRHRIPKEQAQYLVVTGEVAISYIKFEGGPGAAAPMPQPQPPVPGAGYPAPPGQPAFNPPVPYTTALAGGLYPGRMIYISGVPRPNVSRFTVNLMCGPTEDHDIGFHFDIRFNYGGVYNQTVRTHKTGGVWGSEERHQTHFPFAPNANFDMIILTEPNCIKVAVNNQHFLEFTHRIQPLNRITFLNVNGDVRLTSVRVQ